MSSQPGWLWPCHCHHPRSGGHLSSSAGPCRPATRGFGSEPALHDAQRPNTDPHPDQDRLLRPVVIKGPFLMAIRQSHHVGKRHGHRRRDERSWRMRTGCSPCALNKPPVSPLPAGPGALRHHHQRLPNRLHRLFSSHTRRGARRSSVSTRSRAIGSLRIRVGAIRSAESMWCNATPSL